MVHCVISCSSRGGLGIERVEVRGAPLRTGTLKWAKGGVGFLKVGFSQDESGLFAGAQPGRPRKLTGRVRRLQQATMSTPEF